MLVAPSYYILSPSDGYSLKNTRILWDSHTFDVDPADITVSSEAAGGPKDMPLYTDTATFWEPLALPATYELDFGAPLDLNAIGLLANFGSAGVAVQARISADVDDFNDYLSLAGVDANYASTPDTAANSITGDLHLELELAIENADLPDFWLDFLGDATNSVNKIIAGSPTVGTVVRAGDTATNFDVTGNLVTALANTMRIDYHPTTRAPRGFFVEEARTNLIDDSETLGSGAGWVSPGVTAVTVNANTTLWLDGNTVADTVTDSDSLNSGRLQYNESHSSGTLTRCGSYHVLKTSGDPNFACFELIDTGGSTLSARFVFNTNTGAITASTGPFAAFGIDDCGTYWRPWGSITDNNSGNTTFVTELFPAWNTTGSITNLASVNGSKISCGWQIELGAFPSSYIKTSGGSVARAADAVTLTDLSAMDYNQTEGTLVLSAEAGYATTAPTTQSLLEFDDGGVFNNERYAFIRSSTTNLRNFTSRDGGVTQASLTGSAWTALTIAEMAAAYKLNDMAASFDGGTVATDTAATLPTISRMFLGGNSAGTYFNGWLRELYYYATRRVDAKLQDFARGTYRVLASKWVESGNQRSWALCLKKNCALVLFVSTDGTAAGIREYHSAPLTFTEGNRFRVRVKLDLSAGSPDLDSICTFETSDDDGDTWDPVSTITQAAVSGIFNSTAALEVGAFNGGTSEFQGKVFQFMLYADLNDALVAHFDAADGENGDTTVTSSDTGEVWTIHSTGPATALEVKRFSLPVAPGDDAPIMMLDDTRVARRVRLDLTGAYDADTPPRLQVCYAGEAMAMPMAIRGGGAVPLHMARDTELKTRVSRGGQYLGQSIRRFGIEWQATFNLLPQDWIRDTFDPFARHARSEPYFIAWRPEVFPEEVGYCWATGDIIPSYTGQGSFMQVGWKMRGVGWQ